MINKERASLVGPPELWNIKRDVQIRFLLSKGLEKEHYLLDIGCGVLRGGVPLIKYLNETHYYGIEKDSERLEEGVKELNESGEAQKNPHLTTNCETIDRKFDYIWLYQVFIHLTDEILHDTLSIIDSFLKESGVCYATVNVGKRNQGKWKEYPHVFRSLDFYKKSAARHNLSVDTVDDFKHSAHRNQMLKIYKKARNGAVASGVKVQIRNK